MKPIFALAGTLLLTACDPSLFAPSISLSVDPEVVRTGVSEIEVTDDDRRIDFREVADVEDFGGDFFVREWSSNDQRVFAEIDVFEDAFGSQELSIRLENEDVLQAFFTVQ